MRRSVLLLIGLLMAGSAHAQANPDSVKLRNDCRLAAQVLATGHPAPDLEWAHGMIRSCGYDEWAEAASAAIRRLRSSTNEAELSSEWRHLRLLKDAGLFSTVLEIAEDRSASVPARLWALRTLATYIDPEGVYGALTERVPDSPRPACISSRAAGLPTFYEGRPLPDDYPAEARRMASRMNADPSEPANVRLAAICVVAAPVYGLGHRDPSL
jgi:hypothetical protein